MRLPRIELPGRRRPIVGIDIGADGIRLVSVRGHGDTVQIDWCEEISLTELQGFADYDSIEEKLQQVLSSHVRGKADIATVPPWNSARVVIEEMPSMAPARFRTASNWYFQNHPQEDMLDPVNRGIAQPPRESIEGVHVTDALMVSVDRVMLTGLVDLCNRLDVRLQWLAPTPLCYAATVADADASNALVVDIGSGQSRLSIMVDGSIRLVRKLKPSANDVVRAISDELQLGWESANAALLAHAGLGPLAEDDPEGIVARAHDVIESALDTLAETLQGEIQRSIAYLEARHGEHVDHVYLAGGLGGAPGLVARLENGLSHPVAPLDPFAATGNTVDRPVAARPRFALAIGAATLALHQREDTNLLLSAEAPQTQRPRAQRRRAWSASRIAATGLALLVLGAGAAYDTTQSRRIEVLENERAGLEDEQIALRVRARELTAQEDLFAVEGRIEDLRTLYRSRLLFTPFVTQAVDALPEGVRLDHIGIEPSGTAYRDDPSAGLIVQLKGRTRDVNRVGGLVVELESRSLLARIEVLRISEASEDENGWFDFELWGVPVVPRQEEWIAAAAREHAASKDVEVAR